MKNKLCLHPYIVLIFLIIGILQIKAQTYISGGIYTNTTWRSANSPYIVNGNLTIFPSDTLRIERGVIVKVDSAVTFEVRGALISVGTISDSIIFTSSSSSPSKGTWSGIFVNNNVGGSADIQYSSFEYSGYGIRNNCCWNGGPINVSHSSFNNNRIAISGYAGWKVMVDQCSFSNNLFTIIDGDKIITNSSFTDNYYGLYTTERVDVYNSSFCGNTTAISGGRGNLQNSIIMYNGIGVLSTVEGFYNVSGNVISQNDTGIVLGMYNNYSAGLGTNNVICNNDFYNLINNTPLNIAVPNNCWCDINSANISQKIYDGYDNANLGLIDFTSYLVCNSSAIPLSCQMLPTGILSPSVDNIIPNLYPNPMQDYSVLKTNRDLQNAVIRITNVIGQSVLELMNQNGNEFTFYKHGLHSGLYFINVSEQGKIICNLKLIIAD